ncbi:helix-turn-helix domain-containing protein [Enterococcus plantarum]|nr:Rgg/GadR/MutR family transcriptional regulator [Enterococcus plantarum]
MNIPRTIKIFRLKKGLKQSDIHISKFSSTLSRIENGTRNIKSNDLDELINILGINEREFFSYAIFDDPSNDFAIKIRQASLRKDQMLKDHILQQYYIKEYQFSRSSKELAYYYTVKAHFGNNWKLGELVIVELQHIFNHLTSQKYCGYYEYLLFVNTIHFFKTDQLTTIVKHLLPIEEESLRDHDTKRYAYTGLINAISIVMYGREYKVALELIELAEKMDVNNSNYYFRFSIQYFKNIIFYIKTKDMKYHSKIHNFIDLIRDIGDIEIATQLEQEVKRIIFKDDKINIEDLHVSLIKDQ